MHHPTPSISSWYSLLGTRMTVRFPWIPSTMVYTRQIIRSTNTNASTPKARWQSFNKTCTQKVTRIMSTQKWKDYSNEQMNEWMNEWMNEGNKKGLLRPTIIAFLSYPEWTYNSMISQMLTWSIYLAKVTVNNQRSTNQYASPVSCIIFYRGQTSSLKKTLLLSRTSVIF